MTDHLRHDLEESLGLSDYLINRLIDRAPYSYKVYTIPKRSGGQRTIAQPAKEIKFIQRWLIQNIFDKLPVHECASAYKDGASIKKNANSHKSHSYIIKLDFKDFFPSITSSDLVMHISKHLGRTFGAQDIQDIARVSCIRLHGKGDLCLSVGAPSSPVLSNTIMFSFDSEVSAWCAQNGITYTRYADDLTFSTSTKGICSEIESFVKGVTQELDYPNLTLNFNKTTHLSKKHQRRITGVIINNFGALSLGRNRKREISALIHKFSLDMLPESEILRLQGLLGFAKDIEPLFVARMRRKYSSRLIEEVLKKRK
ncbi:RNA-directed DNA polymerase [Acidithiobacillus ferrooxidans]|uniref:retron St85 family RNA-directed DNA polymerase n=1 Tax=Acidithiobacillus ferrooxidans TaxID=920 RepID=UPI001C06C2F1|nr:retron St85 family RNA-directed DNA polymerase [Acidithiobacillus ferrooxidans]MBU2773345.1 RNA-directed DNA polymerase [Acidithiobacillus ferrooxidans]